MALGRNARGPAARPELANASRSSFPKKNTEIVCCSAAAAGGEAVATAAAISPSPTPPLAAGVAIARATPHSRCATLWRAPRSRRPPPPTPTPRPQPESSSACTGLPAERCDGHCCASGSRLGRAARGWRRGMTAAQRTAARRTAPRGATPTRGRVRVGGVAARAAGSTYCASAASAARSALAHASPMRAHITTPPSSARSNPAARSEHERERTRRLGRAAAKEAVVGGIHYARRGRGNRRRLVLERSASPPRPHRSRAVATRRPRRPWRARNSLQLRLEQRRVAPLLRIALRWQRETAAAAACSEPSTAGARKMPRRDPPSASLGGGSTAAVAVAVRSAHARTQRRSQRRW